MGGREAAKLGCPAPPRQISGVLDRLTALSRPDSSFEARLMRDAQYYSTAVLEEEGTMCAVVLASKLAEVGYRVSIRTALGGGSGLKAFAHLSHEFLVVAPPGGQLSLVPEIIVDPHFRDQFDIPQAVPWYRQVVAALPFMYAGNITRLKAMVRLVCGEMGAQFAERGTVTPPWRSVKSLLSKWLPTKARDTSVSDALASSPPCSRLGSFTSVGGGSPAASKLAPPFPGACHTLELRASSGGWIPPGRGSEFPGVVAWPAAAQLAEGGLLESTVLALGGDVSVSPRAASDSEEDLRSLMLSGFSTHLARKSARFCLPAPGAHSPSQAALEAARCVDHHSPQLRCSSLTLAMRGDAISATASVSAAISSGKALCPSSGDVTGAALSSVSDPAPSASRPLQPVFATTETAATQRHDPKSLLLSDATVAAALLSPFSINGGLPAQAVVQSNVVKVYTLTASDAAAIAAAQKDAHPTVRGPHPKLTAIRPLNGEQSAFACADFAAAAKGAVSHSQAPAFVKDFNGLALPNSPASDTGPTVDAPFWSQPVIQDYIRVHSQHDLSRCSTTAMSTVLQRQAPTVQLGSHCDTEAVPRIRTVKMRGPARVYREVTPR